MVNAAYILPTSVPSRLKIAPASLDQLSVYTSTLTIRLLPDLEYIECLAHACQQVQLNQETINGQHAPVVRLTRRIHLLEAHVSDLMDYEWSIIVNKGILNGQQRLISGLMVFKSIMNGQ